MKRCVVCAAPLPKGRSRYCSDDCRRAIYGGNISAIAPEFNVLSADEIAAIHRADRLELKQRNKALEPYGRRICTQHGGAALPLDDEHFEQLFPDKPWRSHTCRKCRSAAIAKRLKTRYHSDADYARQKCEYAAARLLARKRKRLAAVLAGAQLRN